MGKFLSTTAIRLHFCCHSIATPSWYSHPRYLGYFLSAMRMARARFLASPGIRQPRIRQHRRPRHRKYLSGILSTGGRTNITTTTRSPTVLFWGGEDLDKFPEWTLQKSVRSLLSHPVHGQIIVAPPKRPVSTHPHQPECHQFCHVRHRRLRSCHPLLSLSLSHFVHSIVPSSRHVCNRESIARRAIHWPRLHRRT